jgi:hypothetical protein
MLIAAFIASIWFSLIGILLLWGWASVLNAQLRREYGWAAVGSLAIAIGALMLPEVLG